MLIIFQPTGLIIDVEIWLGKKLAMNFFLKEAAPGGISDLHSDSPR